MRSLSAATQRFVAVGSLLLVLLIVYLGVVGPLWDWYAGARADADTLRRAIAHAEAANASAGNLQAELESLKQQTPNANGFLPKTTDALANAALQDLVKAAVDKAHGELRSTQMLAAHDEGSARRISIRAQFTADLAGVQQVFYELESLPSLLFLNNVQVRLQQKAVAGRAAPASTLEVQLDVSGYMQGRT